MSKTETELPARLRDGGATELERRLLSAAIREEPSRALTERMAGALGVALPAAESALREAASVGTPAAPKAAVASSSLIPWASGGLLAAIVAAGFFATRPPTPPGTPPPPATASSGMSAPAAPAAVVLEPSAADIALRPQEATRSVPSASASHRSRSSDVAEQIALIDAARGALTAGGAERALTTVRDYKARYPKGAFGPEADAIKIEAQVKLGRTDEARVGARRFLATHGASPLADRVARVAGLERP